MLILRTLRRIADICQKRRKPLAGDNGENGTDSESGSSEPEVKTQGVPGVGLEVPLTSARGDLPDNAAVRKRPCSIILLENGWAFIKYEFEGGEIRSLLLSPATPFVGQVNTALWTQAAINAGVIDE